MEPNYKWVRIGDHGSDITPSLEWFVKRNNLPHILDIMGAPICDRVEFNNTIKRWIQSDTQLCISGELKRLGEGCPASNYRYLKNKETNDTVIDNYLQLFIEYSIKTMGKPIFVTTIPRDWRIYSWKISEDGDILITDKLKNKVENDILITGLLMNYNLTRSHIIKLRDCCRGSKYNTYLIDMISFLYQIKLDKNNFHDIYNVDYRKITVNNGGSKVGKWTPDKNMSYLYFDKSIENDGYVFYTPKNESVFNIYKEFEEAINPYENETKKNIRNHLLNHRIDRWTDFNANDIDDALTMLMLIHSFNGITESVEVNNGNTRFTKVKYEISSDEKVIYDCLEENMSDWFSEVRNID